MGKAKATYFQLATRNMSCLVLLRSEWRASGNIFGLEEALE